METGGDGLEPEIVLVRKLVAQRLRLGTMDRGQVDAVCRLLNTLAVLVAVERFLEVSGRDG